MTTKQTLRLLVLAFAPSEQLLNQRPSPESATLGLFVQRNNASCLTQHDRQLPKDIGQYGLTLDVLPYDHSALPEVTWRS